MDWDLVVEGNTKALKRILATLVAMAGLGDERISPLVGEMSAKLTEGGNGPSCETPPSALPGISPSRGEIARTLPRRLHRAILRLLRPLESATRRLIIVAARDLPVPDLPPLRPRKPKPDMKAAHAALRRLGLAVVPSSAEIARIAAERRAADKRAASRAARAGLPLALPLLDPRKRFGPRRRYVPAHAAPRILSFDGAVPHKLPPPPGPHDPIDATRLALRLAGISHALNDLPAQAQRFARWKACRARRSQSPSPLRRGWARSPLRPGRAPGWRVRSKDEINEVLADLQYFAREVLAPDTS